MTLSDKTPKRGKAPPRAGGAAKASTTRPKEQQEQTTAKADRNGLKNKAARKAENKGVARVIRVACNGNVQNGLRKPSTFSRCFSLLFFFLILKINRLAKSSHSESSKILLVSSLHVFSPLNLG